MVAKSMSVLIPVRILSELGQENGPMIGYELGNDNAIGTLQIKDVIVSCKSFVANWRPTGASYGQGRRRA